MDYAAPRALCCSARRVEVAARPSSVGEVCLFPALLMVEECCYDSLFSFSSSVRLLGSAESSEGGSPWGPNEGCSRPSGCFVIPNSKCKLAFQATSAENGAAESVALATEGTLESSHLNPSWESLLFH